MERSVGACGSTPIATNIVNEFLLSLRPNCLYQAGFGVGSRPENVNHFSLVGKTCRYSLCYPFPFLAEPTVVQ